MLVWINFWIFFFWIFFFSIFFNLNNFFSLLFNAEILWVVLYVISIVCSLIIDDLMLFSLTFFLLGFAAIELSVGLLLLILMKFNNLSLNFSDNYEYSSKNLGSFFSKNSLNKKTI